MQTRIKSTYRLYVHNRGGYTYLIAKKNDGSETGITLATFRIFNNRRTVVADRRSGYSDVRFGDVVATFRNHPKADNTVYRVCDDITQLREEYTRFRSAMTFGS